MRLSNFKQLTIAVLLLSCASLSKTLTEGKTQFVHYDENYKEVQVKVRPNAGEHFGKKLWQLDDGAWQEFTGNTIRVQNARDGYHLITLKIEYADYNDIIVRTDTIQVPIYMSTSKTDRGSDKFVKKGEGGVTIDLLGLAADAITPTLTPAATLPVDTLYPVAKLLSLGYNYGSDGSFVDKEFTIKFDRPFQEFKVRHDGSKRGEILGDMFWQIDSGELQRITNKIFRVGNAKNGSHLLSVWLNYVNKNGVLVRRELIQVKLHMAVDKWDHWLDY